MKKFELESEQQTVQSKEKINGYFSYFSNLWDGFKPVVFLFENGSGRYLYDNGTNKIIRCQPPVYKALQFLTQEKSDVAFSELPNEIGMDEFTEALGIIVNSIETEKILLSDPRTFIFCSQHFQENYEEECRNSLGQIILEVDQNCNMRCKYCVYNPYVKESRPHANRYMDLNTAKMAVKYLSEHSGNSERLFVSFYGGEPLLRFDVVKECVHYAKTLLTGRNVTFSMTTNGTLINEEIAEFLARESFSLMVSIDGPREIHDEFRVDSHGNGTFDRALRGLKLVLNKYGARAKKNIRLSMVYTPPFGSTRLNKIMELWQKYPFLKGISGNISYPHQGSIPLDTLKSPGDMNEDKEVADYIEQLYLEDYKNKREPTPFVKEQVVNSLVKIFRRPIFDKPSNELYLNGCCLPAVRKLFVNASGDLYLCERIHYAGPAVGNVFSGLEFKKMKDVYVDEYAKKSIGDCSKCWANRLCGACYVDAYDDEKFELNKKRKRCKAVFHNLSKSLNLYTNLLAIDPEGSHPIELRFLYRRTK